MPTQIRKPYGERKKDVVLDCSESEIRTKQSFKRECDINHILAKYRKTGLLDHVQKYQGRYEDITSAVDYQTALNVMLDAESAFNTLPSEVRKKFSNSPSDFLTFVSNPDNADEMANLGLIPKRPLVEQPAPPSAEPEVTP